MSTLVHHSSTPLPRPMKTSTTVNCSPVKQCRVCGDIALGFNFNGLSCESCKAFFRRNAVKNKVFKCRKGGTCIIDKINRKYCKRCRLEKCYKIGMKKEMIWSFKNELQQITNKDKDNSNSSTENKIVISSGNKNEKINKKSTSSSENSPTLLIKAKNSPKQKSAKNQSSYHHYHHHHPKSHNTEYRSSSDDTKSEKDSDEMEIEELEEIDLDSPGSKKLVKSGPILISSKDVILLKTYDLERIQEVRNAMSVYGGEEFRVEVIGSAESLIEVANLAEAYVKKAIKFCKCFSSFTSLSPLDQMVLLKHSFPEVASVYIAFLYLPHKDGFNALMNDEGDKAMFVRMDFSSELKRKDISPNFRKFSIMMKREMENDPAIRDLIIAQLLFKPRRNLNQSEFIRYNNFVYSHLLKRYLEHKYKNPAKAAARFESLKFIMNNISTWSCAITDVFQGEVDPEMVNEVLSEIFNLFS